MHLGRIHSLRTSGTALRFIDVAQDGHWIQAISDSSLLSGTNHLEVAAVFKGLKRGDIISMLQCLEHCSKSDRRRRSWTAA